MSTESNTLHTRKGVTKEGERYASLSFFVEKIEKREREDRRRGEEIEE